MGSRKCEMPLLVSSSLREPTSTHTPIATEWTYGIFSVTTRRPLGRIDFRYKESFSERDAFPASGGDLSMSKIVIGLPTKYTHNRAEIQAFASSSGDTDHDGNSFGTE